MECEATVVSNSGATVTIYLYNNIHSGDAVTLVAEGVTNAPAPGAISISTTSDPVAQSVTSASATASPASVQLSSYAPSATSTYQVNFTTTLGLTGSTTVTLSAPMGTVFASSALRCQFDVWDDNANAYECRDESHRNR